MIRHWHIIMLHRQDIPSVAWGLGSIMLPQASTHHINYLYINDLLYTTGIPCHSILGSRDCWTNHRDHWSSVRGQYVTFLSTPPQFFIYFKSKVTCWELVLPSPLQTHLLKMAALSLNLLHNWWPLPFMTAFIPMVNGPPHLGCISLTHLPQLCSPPWLMGHLGSNWLNPPLVLPHFLADYS